MARKRVKKILHIFEKTKAKKRESRKVKRQFWRFYPLSVNIQSKFWDLDSYYIHKKKRGKANYQNFAPLIRRIDALNDMKKKHQQ